MRRSLIFLCFTLCCFLFLTCGQEEKKSGSDLKPVISGKAIYKTYCIICHGAAGDMGNNGAHDLTKSTLTLQEKITVISNGRNQMTPFNGILSGEEIEAVAKYTEKLKLEN